MNIRKILIATSNIGKFNEMKSFLEDLPFQFLSINDLSEKYEDPEETEETLVGNAILKAKYYGEKTGLLSVADDGGLFLNVFDGWPGVKSARIAGSDEERVAKVLEKLLGVSDRTAYFRVCLVVYDPETKDVFTTSGETLGEILERPHVGGINNYAYNPIFFMPDKNKVYAEMTLQEKNSVSHRGKALTRVARYLQNVYTSKNIVAPLALIIRDGMILSTLRNDPFNSEYHNKWEFPGGALEMGETLEENVIRETKEEAGYDIEIISPLKYMHIENRQDKNYQVCLIPFLCKIIGGDGAYSDHEVLDLKFFNLDELLDQDLIVANDILFKNNLDQIKQLIKEHNL
ncbi:MAG: RdgB/HAM1 family non-canonical purine NTP pyrophosphatase [bacterium]|nr:RdgB/HAM1 family non-canonical purine NTP pyrophosphatase [bacterium]